MVCVEKDKLSQGHIYRLLSQKNYSYMLHVDSGIEVVWKATPKYRECRMGYRVVPSVVAYEFSHDSQHTCQSMTCHGSRMSRKDWHKYALELICSLW